MPLCNIESDRHLNEVPIIYSFDIQFPKSVHKVSWRCIYGSESIKQILSTTELYSVIYVCNAAGTVGEKNMAGSGCCKGMPIRK